MSAELDLIENQLAAIKAEYDHIQSMVEPLKIEREGYAVTAQEANAKANEINDRIEAIYKSSNFMSVAKRYGIMANTRMDLRAAEKRSEA